MNALKVTRAIDLERVPNGRLVRIAGSVIVRQRPGTANGFVFLSMEDETGIMNAIVTPATFDRYKFQVLGERLLLIDGVLQNLDGVISVKAGRIAGLRAGAAAGRTISTDGTERAGRVAAIRRPRCSQVRRRAVFTRLSALWPGGEAATMFFCRRAGAFWRRKPLADARGSDRSLASP